MGIIANTLKKAVVGAVGLELKSEMRKRIRKGVAKAKQAYNEQQEKNRKKEMLSKMSPDQDKSLGESNIIEDKKE